MYVQCAHTIRTFRVIIPQVVFKVIIIFSNSRDTETCPRHLPSPVAHAQLRDVDRNRGQASSYNALYYVLQIFQVAMNNSDPSTVY